LIIRDGFITAAQLIHNIFPCFCRRIGGGMKKELEETGYFVHTDIDIAFGPFDKYCAKKEST
jgi:hypothetical protein